jgi:hypothetical protein
VGRRARDASLRKMSDSTSLASQVSGSEDEKKKESSVEKQVAFAREVRHGGCRQEPPREPAHGCVKEAAEARG